jgi:Membrane-bound metallopeptidase
MRLFLSYSLTFLMLISFQLKAQNRNELERKRSNTLKDIAETEKILNSIKHNKLESVEKLNLLNKKILLRNTLIQNLSAEISAVDNKITELEKETESLTSDVKNIKGEYARMVSVAWLNRGTTNRLMFILASKDFNQAYKRIKYLQQYSEYRQKQIAVIKGIQNTLNSQIVELENSKKEKVVLLSTQEKENKLLQLELQEKTNLVNALKAKEGNLLKRLKEQNVLATRLQTEIENIIKAEIKAKAAAAAAAAERKARKREIASKNGSVKSSSSSVTVAPVSHDDNIISSNFRDNKGRLPWPTERGVITKGFGEYHHPVYKEVKQMSNGIDITTVPGADVRSVFEGQVTSIIFIKGSNYAVLINHGNFYTVYQNLVDIRVKKGDKVRMKQVIGKVFTDANSNSTVLHMEIWEERRILDPEVWLSHN